MQLLERNAVAFDRMARRLVEELATALEAANAVKDESAAGELARAEQGVKAMRGALSGRMVGGRSKSGAHAEAFTVDDLASLAWDAVTAGTLALARWRARIAPLP